MKRNGKRVLFIALFALACLFGVVLTGCDGKENGDMTDEEMSIIEKNWSYINENLENYNIIFSENAGPSETKIIRAFSGTVMKVTGKSATLHNDVDTEIEDTEVGEIIMGVTNRLGSRYESEIADANLEEGSYQIEYIGKDVVVHYNGIDGLSNAVLKLLGYMAPGDNVDSFFLAQLDKIGFSIGSVVPKNVYADNMMLQRNRVTTFIGVSEPNIPITAKLMSHGTTVASGNCVSTENGYWDLPVMMPEGSFETYDLIFYVKDVPVISYANVLVGELWIATGQSNMAYTLAKDIDYSKLKFDDPYYRVLECSKTSDGYSVSPVYENSSCTWYTGESATSMAGSTSIGYFFAQQLRKQLNMPVGLIFYAVGGTPIRSWLSTASIQADKDLFARYQQNGYYVAAKNWDPKGSTTNRNCCALYNTCTSAVQGFTVGGVLWYQGEQDLAETDPYYDIELELLYQQFRQEFGWQDDENLPFVFPDLMPYLATRDPMYQSQLALEMGAFYSKHPNAVSVIQISDTSPEFNSNNNASHPNSKAKAGERLGMAAYSLLTANCPYPSSSPSLKSVRVEGNALIVTLDNVADGLCVISDTAVTVGDTELHGFTVCGSDGVYVMAKAEIISGNEVKVWNDAISSPVGLSYCYGFSSYYSNLGCRYDGKLLYPAIPFSYNTPSGAKELSWLPWANCDQEILWRVSRESTHYGAYQYAWKSSGATLTYNMETPYEGRASLSLAYGNGTFSASPVFSGNTIDGVKVFRDFTVDYSPYGKMTLMVRNEGSQAVTLESLCISGSAYCKVSAESECAGGVIAADGQWHKLVIDLTNATTSVGTGINPASFLRSTSALELKFSAGASGTLCLDDIQFLP